MKRAWKTLSVAVALFAGVGMAQAATSGCQDGAGPQHKGSHLKQMTKELGLNAQQKGQVQEIFKKNHEQNKPQMDQMISERRTLRGLIQADSIDEAAIRAQAAKVAAIEADMAVTRARMAQQMRAVLTPEQIQKFKAQQAKRDQLMDERHAKRADRMDRK